MYHIVSVAMANELAAVSDAGIAVIDAVKLLEGGSGAFCQSKWLVVCPEEQEMERLMTRNHLSEAHRSCFSALLPPLASRAISSSIDSVDSSAYNLHRYFTLILYLSRKGYYLY